MTTDQETLLALILAIVERDCIRGFRNNGKVDFEVCKTGLQHYEKEDGSSARCDTGSRKITITIDCPNQITTE